MQKSYIRYRLYCVNPKTGREIVAEEARRFMTVAKTMEMNLRLNPEYYSDDNGKRVKMRFVAEEVRGKKVKVIDVYTITKAWKIHGHLPPR